MLTLRASAIGGCPRALFYQATKVAGEPRSLTSRLTLRLGTVMEAVILEELGYRVEDAQKEIVLPIPWSPAVAIVGHPDGRVGDTVIEVKTMNQFAFRQVKKHGVKEHYPQYLMQASCYLAGLQGEALRFICFNKDSSDILEQEYPRAEVQPYWEAAQLVARTVAEGVWRKQEPVRPQRLPAWRCRRQYCEFWHCEHNDGYGQSVMKEAEHGVLQG
jgi:hypothetical protein